MRKLLWFLLFFPLFAFAQGGTTSSDILPANTGQNLGNPNQQWNLFMQDGRFYRHTYLSNASGTRTFDVIPSFSTALVTCTQNDGTRCYFDSGSATTNGLRDCGIWNPTTAYQLQCVVQSAGGSWVARAPNIGILPGSDNGVDWGLFAIAGSNGVNGTNGSDGAPGIPGYSPNQLISGGGVVWVSNYNYTVSAASYIVQNIGYSSPQTNITLPASDPTFDRCDAVIVDNTGTVSTLTGVAAAQPSCPVASPSTQLQITTLRVDANTTQPGTIVQTDIYHENVEWTMTKTGTPINLASTNNPHSGTLDIEGTNAVTGNFFTATDPLAGTVDLATRNNLVFYIRPKAAWPTGTRSITIQWYNGTTPKGTPVVLANSNFAFNSTNLTYQQIVIPTSLFAANGIPMTAVRFTMTGTSTVAFGWYIDDIILQGGVPPSQGSNAMVWQDPYNATKAYAVNDTVSYQNNAYVAMIPNVAQTPSATSTIWHPATNAGPPWVSLSSNPASVGIIRLVNATDKECWRNGTNSGDLCFWLDSSNVWNFDGATGTELGMQGETTGASTQPSSGYTTFVNSATALLCTKDSAGAVVCSGSGSGSGTVTSIATTSPITGGTITSTGTIACATCAIGPGSSTANHLAKFSGTDGVTLADGGAIPAGTVTSIATTSPLGGGTITGTGTLTCTTCVVASSPGAGVAHFAGSTQTVTSSAIVGGDMTNNTVTSTQTAVVNNRRTCMMQIGDGTTTVVSADYSPFKVNACYFPYASTIVEINIQCDAGTPSILLERRRGAATLADLLSGALASAGTTHTCALTGTSGTCIDGTTSSNSITLSNTSLNAGDIVEIKSGTGSTEKSCRVATVVTVN
jgi:hypothetical protein